MGTVERAVENQLTHIEELLFLIEQYLSPPGEDYTTRRGQ
jgi:hypothetical protein